MNRSWIRWAVVLIVFVAVFSAPLVVWQFQEKQVLNVAILDKTVPDTTYREHKGLIWLLNYFKYVKKDMTAYSDEQDYFGYVPGEDDQYTVRDLNTSDGYDLIYLADSYGVYKDDLSDIPLGNRSEKIYGGLEQSDIAHIKDAVFSGTPLIAEFNTFGSPTDKDTRTAMYEILGVRWSGWIGRYFPDLSSDGEIPEWAVSNYEQQTGEKWEFQGPGFLFVNEENQMAVLEEGKESGEGGNVFSWTEKGEAFVGSPVQTRYNYWFDVIEAGDNSEVWATYQLDLTDAGKAKLTELGIPTTFPAVVKHDTGVYTSYYFAGDYADNGEVPGFYQAAWLDRVYSAFAWESDDNQQAFYWKAYRPLMERIFQEIAKEKRVTAAQEEDTSTANVAGMTIPAKAGENYLQIYQNGSWNDFLIKGVNIGMAKPGHFPGEAAITKEEYLRWLTYIGEMNANAIRVYTIHPPAFYEALLEYNSRADSPIYLLHGVWINEERLVSTSDAYTEELVDEYFQEMRRTVDVIHGNADLPVNPGHSSGAYRADVSQYVIAWLLGIEWDPEAVVDTNNKHQGTPDYSGRYFRTENASPFESWLASTMDEISTYEAERYQWQRPITFTNWPTTDLLEHPSEPLAEEDMVSINPHVIKVDPSFQAGYFASYHVYPYYPDFMNYEEKYTDYVDFRGEKNSYAGYLHDLKQSHKMPVLIAEFGVPASRGITHRNVHGWNQGHHNEQEQGRIGAHLFEDIYREGMAGGILFTWQDEWFKRTWNTMDLDNPDQRPYWSNIQTSEQYFGVFTFDPGKPETALYADGDAADWTRSGIEPIRMKGAVAQAVDDDDRQREIKQMFVSSDERNVYFRLDFGQSEQPLDWSKTGAMILLDTIPDQGQHRVPGGSSLTTNAGIDFVIDLRGPDQSRIWVDSYYDSTYYEYGHRLQMMPSRHYANKKNNGVFHKMELVLNQTMDIPNVRGGTLHLPIETFETGRLRYGNGHPDSPNFDSLADVSYNEQERIVEVRIPWQLLNVKDPSHHEIMGDLWENGPQGSMKTPGFTIAAVTYRPDQQQTDMPGSQHISYAMPGLEGNILPAKNMFTYKWDTWVMPVYHERLKKSYYMMQEIYQKTTLAN